MFGGCYRALEEALPAFVKLLEDVGSVGGGGGGGSGRGWLVRIGKDIEYP